MNLRFPDLRVPRFGVKAVVIPPGDIPIFKQGNSYAAWPPVRWGALIRLELGWVCQGVNKASSHRNPVSWYKTPLVVFSFTRGCSASPSPKDVGTVGEKGQGFIAW